MFEDFYQYIDDLPYISELNDFWNYEYSNFKIHPKRDEIFRSFNLLKDIDLKIVIIGQDPYSNENQANGLAFSVNKGIKLPPSLKNIYKELENEFKFEMDYSNGDLAYLAKQGVLLINTILTIRDKEPLSHDNKLYKKLFLDILKYLDNIDSPIVFMLWGGSAKKYKKYITNKKRLVIETNHPSPLSANRFGWFNSNCFIDANYYLISNNIEPINYKNN